MELDRKILETGEVKLAPPRHFAGDDTVLDAGTARAGAAILVHVEVAVERGWPADEYVIVVLTGDGEAELHGDVRQADASFAVESGAHDADVPQPGKPDVVAEYFQRPAGNNANANEAGASAAAEKEDQLTVVSGE